MAFIKKNGRVIDETMCIESPIAILEQILQNGSIQIFIHDNERLLYTRLFQTTGILCNRSF